MQVLRLLALAPFLVLQDPAPEATTAEPPLRFRLTIGEEVIELEEGHALRPRPEGPTYLLEALPTRMLRVSGAFAFEYPREFAFLGALGSREGWCSVTGQTTMIHLQRHAEEPAEVVERYVQAAEGSGARNVRESAITLGGRTLTGRAFDQHIGGLHGWEAEMVQEVYGFEQSGSGWLLMIQSTFEPAGQTHIEPLLVQLGVPQPPYPGQSAETGRALELLRTTFRFGD
ncbi:MAG: hypothetical protein EYC70_05665 [Planctomycetota bacterium]|nr:MAG: hypothetical protein EYC70_05665 [Planctomycetota bacterium]